MNDTVRAYDAEVEAYAAATAAVPDSVRALLHDLATRLGRDARVLEIGSGGGRDAALMEELGLRVRRTDITPGFVTRLREQGHDADVLDPLVDDLTSADGAYDAVWANASLLHVARADLETVLRRLAAVTRPGGLLRLAVKEGDGDGWSTHGSISSPRHFTYWRQDALVDVVEAAGWDGVAVRHEPGTRDESWLLVAADRR